MSTVLYAIAGLAILAGTVGLYFASGQDVPKGLTEWASFGTYVAGIAGPSLSFLALIALARTMQFHSNNIELQREKQLADQHLRWLDALYQDITEAVGAHVSNNVTLRAVLDGDASPKSVYDEKLKARLEDLLKLVAQYCRAVDMYRDNVSEFYDLQIYADRGGRILDAIKRYADHLGAQALPTIEFCDMHLRGENKRSSPEAMQRSSRTS